MTARVETELLQMRLSRRGINLTFEQANTLRRAEKTLHRWYEQECGDGNNYVSWAIERDEETDIPYRCVYPHQGNSYRERISDREAGAKRRVEAIAKSVGFHVYYQTDPRGCTLYISLEPFEEFDHTNGVAVAS